GDTFKTGTEPWTIVGTFDANGTAFDSEIWGDVDYIMHARKRTAYSSVLARPVDGAALTQVADTIRNDNRLKLQVKSELDYYKGQTEGSGLVGIKVLVFIVTVFMVLGAILGTSNTMFSAIAPRQRELATLRALGFNRRTVIGTVVLESAI